MLGKEGVPGVTVQCHFREHLDTDMRDRELSYWTCRGVNTSGFFVATIDEEVVGTVSYIKEADHLEIFRLSVDMNHRKCGVAAALIEKIIRVGAILKVDRIKAQTSNAQESAIAFYNKNNWSEVYRS